MQNDTIKSLNEDVTKLQDGFLNTYGKLVEDVEFLSGKIVGQKVNQKSNNLNHNLLFSQTIPNSTVNNVTVTNSANFVQGNSGPVTSSSNYRISSPMANPQSRSYQRFLSPQNLLVSTSLPAVRIPRLLRGNCTTTQTVSNSNTNIDKQNHCYQSASKSPLLPIPRPSPIGTCTSSNQQLQWNSMYTSNHHQISKSDFDSQGLYVKAPPLVNYDDNQYPPSSPDMEKPKGALSKKTVTESASALKDKMSVGPNTNRLNTSNPNTQSQRKVITTRVVHPALNVIPSVTSLKNFSTTVGNNCGTSSMQTLQTGIKPQYSQQTLMGQWTPTMNLNLNLNGNSSTQLQNTMSITHTISNNSNSSVKSLKTLGLFQNSNSTVSVTPSALSGGQYGKYHNMSVNNNVKRQTQTTTSKSTGTTVTHAPDTNSTVKGSQLGKDLPSEDTSIAKKSASAVSPSPLRSFEEHTRVHDNVNNFYINDPSSSNTYNAGPGVNQVQLKHSIDNDNQGADSRLNENLNDQCDQTVEEHENTFDIHNPHNIHSMTSNIDCHQTRSFIGSEIQEFISKVNTNDITNDQSLLINQDLDEQCERLVSYKLYESNNDQQNLNDYRSQSIEDDRKIINRVVKNIVESGSSASSEIASKKGQPSSRPLTASRSNRKSKSGRSSKSNSNVNTGKFNSGTNYRDIEKLISYTTNSNNLQSRSGKNSTTSKSQSQNNTQTVLTNKLSSDKFNTIESDSLSVVPGPPITSESLNQSDAHTLDGCDKISDSDANYDLLGTTKSINIDNQHNDCNYQYDNDLNENETSTRNLSYHSLVNAVGQCGPAQDILNGISSLSKQNSVVELSGTNLSNQAVNTMNSINSLSNSIKNRQLAIDTIGAKPSTTVTVPGQGNSNSAVNTNYSTPITSLGTHQCHASPILGQIQACPALLNPVNLGAMGPKTGSGTKKSNQNRIPSLGEFAC